MPHIIRPATVRILPKEGEIEITLNINITVDGVVTASASNAERVVVEQNTEEDKVVHVVPDFLSGFKLSNFGK